MKKSGPMPRRKESIKWSSNVAYALGLLATDGCLSSSGRHIDLTSKDMEQLENFKQCLNLNTNISYKTSGYTNTKYPRVQFGDVVLYRFLLKVGFTPAKTKTIRTLAIPDRFFFDFLRGHHDGDGCFYSYWDPRWKSSFMFYTTFISASKMHIRWLQRRMEYFLGVKGTIYKTRSIYGLRYAKRESLKVLRQMYKDKECICLTRKKLKIQKALGIVGERL